MHRRHLLGAAALAPLAALTAPRPAGAQAAAGDPAAAIRAGGVVVAFRHALAPGTFDPPEFRVDDCRTQRNLSAEGRAQAERMGRWFKARGLVPAALRSSPWCRCLDTARLAFGEPEAWPALGSPRGSDARTNATRIPTLTAALAAVPAGRFEVWVTHNFVLSDLAGVGTSSGEGLVLRAGEGGRVEVVARIPPA